MRHTDAGQVVDAVQGRLLPVRDPVPDFRCEAMFMFPWAVIVREVGVAGLFNILFFMLILVLGLAYAGRKELWNGNKGSQHQIDEIRCVQ